MSELTSFAAADVSRFRESGDWFVVTRTEAVIATHIGGTAERIVDVWHSLLASLDPVVDVRIDDLRSGRKWGASLLALPDVREAVGRLRLTLAAYGGVELSVFTGDDQLTLTPELLAVAYARTDRWAFILDGLGLAERPHMPARSWTPRRDSLAPAPQLEAALRSTAARLGLEEQLA
ncbi:hypothetical protein [Gemmatimonas sp.]